MRPRIYQRQRVLVSTVSIWIGLLLIGCQARSADRASVEIWKEFSGERALAHVQRLVDLGPRPPASEALEKARRYIDNELQACGWRISEQAFTDTTPRGPVRFANLIGRFQHGNPTKSGPLFLLCSHYDTKAFENVRFLGANDAGSSTGLLLEMARVLEKAPRLATKVELVFFDGEEAYEEFSARDGLYGSRHFARQLTDDHEGQKFRGGILFDMVGDRSLNITLPPDSPARIAHDLFASAEALNLRKYFSYFDRGVTDDHTPLNAIGIPTIDVIDFDFAWWHTPEDTMDKLSAQSLQIVGSVAAYYLAEFAFK
jgi:glutaminyl-peptide cyclotransferase